MAMLSLGGCAILGQPANRTPDDELKKTADFYWQYAALAADVYQTEGRVDSQLALVMMSSWLRDEIASGDPRARAEYGKVLELLASRSNPLRREVRCSSDTPLLEYDFGDNGAGIKDVRCRAADAEGAETGIDQVPTPSEVRLRDFVPTEPKQCEYHGDAEPFVPVHLAMEELNWERVPELQRQLHPRAWSIFVPGLAIDVWRRKLDNKDGVPAVEYALVYRGTVGTGGWFSNLRAVTAFTPFVWDQYRQALRATTDLVTQIYNLHSLSDKLFERPNKTRIYITSVGHSLGGGLAKYAFLRVPEMTRVVGFDPSPVDGSATFSPEPVSPELKQRGARDRASVTADRAQPIHSDPRDPEVSMFLLYEEGELLTRVAGCQSGPIWGAEGGPQVRCESVDLAGGSIFYQHNMAQLACTLFLAKDGKLVQRKR